MAKSLYIVDIEPRSGKSVISLGIMEILSRRIRNAGYFRPVIPCGSQPDNNIQLIRTRYSGALAYEEMYGVTNDAAQKMSTRGRSLEAIDEVVIVARESFENKGCTIQAQTDKGCRMIKPATCHPQPGNRYCRCHP